MKQISSLSALALILASCHSAQLSPLQTKILAQCREQQADCLVHLATATDFTWTQCYIFHDSMGDSVVARQTGSRYPFSHEFSISVVFLKGHAVVYHEEIPVPLEHYEPGDLALAALCRPNYESQAVYTPQTAIFRLRRTGDPGAEFYELLPR